MVGTIELAADGSNLLIRFPYREDLVEVMRTIPNRRWDKFQKTWKVPSKHVESVVDAFLLHGFEMAPEVSGLLAGTVAKGATKSKTADTPPESPAEETAAMSISALNERVRSALRDAFPEPVWVVGELSDFDKNKDRKHVFFTLVEKAEHADRPAARVEVALFERQKNRLLQKMEQAGGLALQDGVEIRAQVRVDLYPASGRYQVIVEDIDPSFTLGKLALTREQILAELRSLGLERRNAELTLPELPLRIGVLASLDSDGFNDFVKEIQHSGSGFELTCYSIRVQGEALRPTLLAGLDYFAQRVEDLDALVIVRGGGSRTDLAWFDDREVALAVAKHPTKILCGIGHERDQSVLDQIAHSEKTPTAVARHLAEVVRAAGTRIEAAGTRLERLAMTALNTHRTALARSAQRIERATRIRLQGERQRLAEQARRIVRGSHVRLERERADLRHRADGLASSTRLRLATYRSGLQDAGRRLASGTTRRLDRATAHLDQANTRLRLLDPRRVLDRGYVLVRGLTDSGDRKPALLPDAAALTTGQSIELEFRDGRVGAHVDEVRPNPPSTD